MRAQMNLALFHGKVESADHPSLEAQRDIVRRLKERLAGLRVIGLDYRRLRPACLRVRPSAPPARIPAHGC